MRAGWLIVVLASAITAASPRAFAQATAKGTPSNTDPSTVDEGPARPREAKTDRPAAYQAMAEIGKARDAFAIRDLPKAIASYETAATKAPTLPLPQYLLGETYLAAGRPEDAEKAWRTALRLTEKQDSMRAKVLFVLADLRERQGRLDEALDGWNEYATFVEGHPNVQGRGPTAKERRRVLEIRKDMVAKYSKVKDRIRQRLEDAQAAGSK